jgi:hypothetical protein
MANSVPHSWQAFAFSAIGAKHSGQKSWPQWGQDSVKSRTICWQVGHTVNSIILIHMLRALTKMLESEYIRNEQVRGMIFRL